MSYILDALKKLEHDKTRRSSPKGTVNISRELFREERLSASCGGALKVVVVVIVVSLATFGTTWFVLKDNKVQDVAQPPHNPPVISTPIPVVPTVQPVVIAPAATPQQVAPVASATASAPPAVPAIRGAETSANQDEDNSSRRRVRRNQGIAPVPVLVPTPARQENNAPVSGLTPPVDIKVSGIAWQDERSARRAVVNGFLMKEGSVVSGVKITEILQDRVRFSQSGSVFEIYLIASGMQGPGK